MPIPHSSRNVLYSNPFDGNYQRRRSPPIGISLSFLLLLCVFLLSCAFAAKSNGHTVFVGVVAAWLLSLVFHEFGHAIVAWYAGDYSVESKGYLRFDICNYMDPFMTLAMPVLLLFLGGIALPGGAVQLDTEAIHSRTWLTAAALGGPAGSLFSVIVFTVMHLVIKKYYYISMVTPLLSVSIYFTTMSVILNLIPLPPLDGWSAVQPWLPDSCFLKKITQNPWHNKSVSLLTFLAIFLILSHFAFPSYLFTRIVMLLGVDQLDLDRGFVFFNSALPF